jgi:hypothetical protein
VLALMQECNTEGLRTQNPRLTCTSFVIKLCCELVLHHTHTQTHMSCLLVDMIFRLCYLHDWVDFGLGYAYADST